MKIIAIESSHDDTSVVIYENRKILKDFSYSQTDFHKMYGGTVPEFASRKHAEKFNEIGRLLKEEDLSDVDHIAFTSEPGLIGSLHMGRLFAYGLGYALNVPVKPINHMHAHIFAAAFEHDIQYPSIALIASGGHTQLWNVKSVDDIELLGETSDDAAGEVFDKVARKLKLGFPGGPRIQECAWDGEDSINFKIPFNKNFNFSFSGFKTQVINYIHNLEQKSLPIPTPDICRSFQDTIVNHLVKKTKLAVEKYNPKNIILGGGVAANEVLRTAFELEFGKKALIPSKKYTTDNAAMIAVRSALKEKSL